MSKTPYQYIERAYCMTFFPGDIVQREEQSQRLATVANPRKSHQNYVNVILPETGRTGLFHPGSLTLVEFRGVRNEGAKPSIGGKDTGQWDGRGLLSEFYHWSLVISSAVNHSDPNHKPQISDLLRRNREFLAAVQTETPELLEQIGRIAYPELWARSDLYRDDDDWNGHTALNARNRSHDKVRKIIAAIYDQEVPLDLSEKSPGAGDADQQQQQKPGDK